MDSDTTIINLVTTISEIDYKLRDLENEINKANKNNTKLFKENEKLKKENAELRQVKKRKRVLVSIPKRKKKQKSKKEAKDICYICLETLELDINDCYLQCSSRCSSFCHYSHWKDMKREGFLNCPTCKEAMIIKKKTMMEKKIRMKSILIIE